LADFDHAVDLNPNNPTALYFRGRIRAANGDLREAIVDLEAALTVSPPSWSNRREVEAALRELRSRDAARK
jgi:cytochrome c-type biogenesis protein CcmH/NrfG